jgi:TolB-like protein
LTAHFNLIVNAQNWDEESSDEEALQTEITEEVIEEIQQDAPRKKQRAGG